MRGGGAVEPHVIHPADGYLVGGDLAEGDPADGYLAEGDPGDAASARIRN